MSVELSLATDLTKMTVVQLREQLKLRALSTNGTKSELIERLKESVANEEKILETDDSVLKENAGLVTASAAVEDDVLGPESSPKKTTDDLNVTEGEGKSIAKENPTKGKETQKKKHDEETLDAQTKRALRFGLPLSNEELKRKRAERFGLSAGDNNVHGTSDEEKKRRRLERFGPVGGAPKSNETALTGEEALKKRAERFGLEFKGSSPTSNKPSSIGDVEKASLEALERRAKRFGVCSEQAEVEIKKLRRAERFDSNKS